MVSFQTFKYITVMVLTKDFIAKNFELFNREYFDGDLTVPSFEITHVKSYLGQFSCRYGYVIRISDYYARSERDFQQTILHEMIHLYIHQNGIDDGRFHHGPAFKRIACRINGIGGWNISRTGSVDGCGLSKKCSDNEYYVGCFLSGSSNKYFRFVINKKYVTHYIKEFSNKPFHYRDGFIIKSRNDKTYSHYPCCRSSVRGFYIDLKEFNEMRKSSELVYSAAELAKLHTIYR